MKVKLQIALVYSLNTHTYEKHVAINSSYLSSILIIII